VRSASGDDGRKLFQCGAQRARIQGPRCNEPVRQSTSTSTILLVLGPIKSKNTIHCHDSRVEVLIILLLKNQVLWDKTLCCQAGISERLEGWYSLYPQAEYEGTTVPRNVGNHSPNDTASHTAGPE
jgi:hypothetical protein